MWLPYAVLVAGRGGWERVRVEVGAGPAARINVGSAMRESGGRCTGVVEKQEMCGMKVKSTKGRA